MKANELIGQWVNNPLLNLSDSENVVFVHQVDPIIKIDSILENGQISATGISGNKYLLSDTPDGWTKSSIGMLDIDDKYMKFAKDWNAIEQYIVSISGNPVDTSSAIIIDKGHANSFEKFDESILDLHNKGVDDVIVDFVIGDGTHDAHIFISVQKITYNDFGGINFEYYYIRNGKRDVYPTSANIVCYDNRVAICLLDMIHNGSCGIEYGIFDMVYGEFNDTAHLHKIKEINDYLLANNFEYAYLVLGNEYLCTMILNKQSVQDGDPINYGLELISDSINPELPWFILDADETNALIKRN